VLGLGANYSTSKSKSKVKVYKTVTDDPLFNLAIEEWLFREGDPSTHSLYLWRNSPTVVIGRHQNPFKECHLQKMEENNVVLARRYSGGGAVYQDLGNTNFTFFSSSDLYDKHRNSGIIINALAKYFGITAEASGRNDILVSGQKVSGSAYKISGKRALHHGTLLLSVDFNALGSYLNPDKMKLKSKGVASVQARVRNLSELNPAVNHQSICEALIKEFSHTYQAECQVEELDPAQLKTIPALHAFYESLKDWNWRFGETPAFEHHMETRFDWGNLDVNMNCQEGRIIDVKIFSDSLIPQMIDELMQSLKGKTYDKAGIVAAVQEAQRKLADVDCAAQLQQLQDWLIKTI
jgi:lipoate-protein ligase A